MRQDVIIGVDRRRRWFENQKLSILHDVRAREGRERRTHLELWLNLGDATGSGGAALGGVGLGDAVGEFDAFDDAGQQVSSVELAPCLRGGPDEREDHEFRRLL